jgi:hypothetical protein
MGGWGGGGRVNSSTYKKARVKLSYRYFMILGLKYTPRLGKELPISFDIVYKSVPTKLQKKIPKEK